MSEVAFVGITSVVIPLIELVFVADNVTLVDSVEITGSVVATTSTGSIMEGMFSFSSVKIMLVGIPKTLLSVSMIGDNPIDWFLPKSETPSPLEEEEEVDEEGD